MNKSYQFYHTRSYFFPDLFSTLSDACGLGPLPSCAPAPEGRLGQDRLCTDGRSLMDAITLASQGRLEPESKIMLARGEGQAAYKQEIGERTVKVMTRGLAHP